MKASLHLLHSVNIKTRVHPVKIKTSVIAEIISPVSLTKVVETAVTTLESLYMKVKSLVGNYKQEKNREDWKRNGNQKMTGQRTGRIGREM